MSDYESDAEAVVRIMRTVRLRDLMGSDGCNCGSVSLRGFEIERSCHKSESSLRVSHRPMDATPTELSLVMTEALAQMREEDGWADILVRYCNYTSDHKRSGYVDGKWVRSNGACTYCGEPRDDRDAYLCAKHLADPDIASRYSLAGITPHGLQLGDRSDDV